MHVRGVARIPEFTSSIRPTGPRLIRSTGTPHELHFAPSTRDNAESVNVLQSPVHRFDSGRRLHELQVSAHFRALTSRLIARPTRDRAIERHRGPNGEPQGTVTDRHG